MSWWPQFTETYDQMLQRVEREQLAQIEKKRMKIKTVLVRNMPITLVNFGSARTVVVPEAAGVALSMGLIPTLPVHVRMIRTYHPALHTELGMDPVGIVATTEIEIDRIWRVCCEWIGNAQNKESFIPSRYPLHDSYWFAFRRRSEYVLENLRVPTDAEVPLERQLIARRLGGQIYVRDKK